MKHPTPVHLVVAETLYTNQGTKFYVLQPGEEKQHHEDIGSSTDVIVKVHEPIIDEEASNLPSATDAAASAPATAPATAPQTRQHSQHLTTPQVPPTEAPSLVELPDYCKNVEIPDNLIKEIKDW